MTFAVQEAWEIGLFHVVIIPSHPLFYVFWVTLLLGALFQQFLLKRRKHPRWKWAYLILLCFGLTVCEIGCWVITGWDRLLPLIGWWLFLTLFLGAGVCTLLWHLAARRKSSSK